MLRKDFMVLGKEVFSTTVRRGSERKGDGRRTAELGVFTLDWVVNPTTPELHCSKYPTPN